MIYTLQQVLYLIIYKNLSELELCMSLTWVEHINSGSNTESRLIYSPNEAISHIQF